LEQSASIQTSEAHPGADGVGARVVNLGHAGIAHDLNNLLTPVIWMLDSLRAKQAGIPVQYPRIEGAIASVERARSSERQLSDIQARQQVSTIVRTPELLRESKKLSLCVLGPYIKLAFNTASPLPAIGDNREWIERALINLIINARETMRDGGTVTIGVHTEFRCAATLGQAEIGLHISICDTGAAMDAATVHRAARQYFSTKSYGCGFGLAVTRDLIEQLGGDMTIASLPGIGTTIEIWLPAARGAIDLSPNDPRDRVVKGAVLSHQA
jgi:signal transduction histidine kinase